MGQLRRSVRRAAPFVAPFVAALLVLAGLSGCARVLAGRPSQAVVPAARLRVIGDSHASFDTEVKKAISDVTAFWKASYPKVSGGAPFSPLKGGLFSIDGLAIIDSGQAPAAARSEKCLAEQPDFIVDNAAYCVLDDSVVWDRNPAHLLPLLASSYGPDVVALVLAHELGHAIQARLGTVDEATPTIDAESQADCAAGAFAAYALAGHAKHFAMTASTLDEALVGFLQIRDTTPASPRDISHGNGFDRLSAVDDGIRLGASYCFSAGYFTSRHFTERAFVSDADRSSGGNQPLTAVLDPNTTVKDPNAGGLQPDLNRFWTKAGKSIHQTFVPVKFVEAAHPKCGSTDKSSEFGYCPADNTVYYSHQLAVESYYSMTELAADPNSANMSLHPNQPGDFALGTLIAVGWGMAARHQFFSSPTTDRAALLAAICYAGAYAADVNLPQSDQAHPFVLSPPDMDEATSAVLTLVNSPSTFGPRFTSGLDRVQAFVTGYAKGLHGC